ncbi:MAG: FAD-dependent oxidoreductase [Planctomycetia bacterium]|nr:FAD-dependent oxidoreductase [Planctomycetia bacterium]
MSLTRRDILTAFLGLPAALAGCSSSRRPTSALAGEIVGPSMSIGHRLRDGERFIPAQDQWERSPVVIVGGGIAGLAAAWRFRKAGFQDFVLLELEPEPGGTSRSGRSSLIAYPWGAHYIPVPLQDNRLVIRLFEDMGVLEGRDAHGDPVVAEQYLCRDPEERLFVKGRWYEGLYPHVLENQADREQYARFQQEVDRWVLWRDGKDRRAFTLPVSRCSDEPEATELDKLSMAAWLDRQGLTSAPLRWYVDYACRDDYGSSVEYTSAWAGLFYFASRRKQPGAEGQPLITWPEGNGRVANYLYEQVKERVRLGWAVADVNPTDPADKQGVEVTAVAGDGLQVRGYHAEQVVFAAPRYLARHLIRPWRQSPPRHLAEFQYGAWLVANLHLKDRPPTPRGFPLAWDNVLFDSPSLGYVVATHQRGIDYGPSVFTYYYPLVDADPVASRQRLLGLDWQACADVVLTDLRRAHPEIDALTERLDVMRWGHAMIRPRPGFLWGGARQAAAQPERGIHFANADLSGVGLFEEAFHHGVRAAEEVLTARGIHFESLM